MTWTTKCPVLFSHFIQEQNMDKIEKALREYEICHGVSEQEEIEVVFFRRPSPRECPHILPEGSTNYTSCESFQFYDKMETRQGEFRQLLVRLV